MSPMHVTLKAGVSLHASLMAHQAKAYLGFSNMT